MFRKRRVVHVTDGRLMFNTLTLYDHLPLEQGLMDIFYKPPLDDLWP